MTEAARAALEIALAWKPTSALAREQAETPEPLREKWASQQVERLCQIEASSVRAALRTWKLWRKR